MEDTSVAQRYILSRRTLGVGVALLLLVLFAHQHFGSSSLSYYTTDTNTINNNVASRLSQPGTSYRGQIWHNERTETLGETKFARCDVHTVMSEDGTSVVNDWLFLEEIDAVNIIVQTIGGEYVFFNQAKYAIPGKTLSPVGGFIDEGESPLTSAKREVLEELGLGSRRTLRTVQEGMIKRGGSNDNTTIPFDVEAVAKVITDNATISDPPIVDDFGLLDGTTSRIDDDDWIFLGRYRTAANRGGGFLYSYLLKNAVPLVQRGGTINYKGTGDGESQEILFLSEMEVMKALSEGRFQEVKWAATLSLAMLHLNNGMPSCCGDERRQE